MVEDVKLCKACKLKMVVSNFYYSGSSYSSKCKACLKKEREKVRHPDLERKRLNRKLKEQGLKQCKGCDEIKNLDHFYTCKAYTDAYCKECNGTKIGAKGATSKVKRQ